MTRRDMEAMLTDYVRQLGDDEVEALLLITQGLARGRTVYGELDVSGDPRDFGAEAGEELRDCMVYTAAALMRLRRRRR